MEVELRSFLTSAPNVGWPHAPAAVTPEENAGTQLNRSLGWPQNRSARFERRDNPLTPAGIRNPYRRVSSRYYEFSIFIQKMLSLGFC